MKFFQNLLNLNGSKSELKISRFKSVESFWKHIIRKEKWYNEYAPHQIKDVQKYIEKLAPLIIETTNKLRVNLEFSNNEYYRGIIPWDNLALDYFNTYNLNVSPKFETFCSNCKKERGFDRRYPKALCHDCTQEISDKDGRKVEFFNSMNVLCQGYYVGTHQKEKYDSTICYIGEKEFEAYEAKFGGIVIELKE